LVRDRGRSMIKMTQTEFPGLEIWCLYGMSAFGYDYYEDVDPQTAMAEAGYGLWSSFFNGWVDGMVPTTSIVDGNEPSYYFTRTAQYTEQKRHVRDDLSIFLSSDAQSKYKSQVKMGHAVYVDAVMNTWTSPRFIGYYFTKDSDRIKLLHSNTLNALQSSESLVWVYSEVTKWWQAAPRKGIDNAVRRAKADYVAGKSPPRPWRALRVAETGVKEAKSIGGEFSSADGSVAYQPTGWGTELNNNACVTWGDRGSYSCTFPKGSTVTITPRIDGMTISPRYRTFQSLAADDWSVNWIVQ
jgi:hypothetical protein